MEQKYFYLDNIMDQLTDIPPDSILSRTYYQDEHLKAILFGFAAGQELSEHTASRPAILHFLAGEGSVSLGEDNYEIKPGAWIYMQPELPHSIKAKTNLIMILIML